jgi:hypothetical protein
MDLHASLVPVVAASLDPAPRDEALQHMTDGGALHAKPRGQARGRNSGLFADAHQGAVHRDRRFGHALELAIERAHAIDEGARRQERVALEGTATGGPGCAKRSFSRC